MGFAVNVYKSIAVFQPVVNGVGGNLVAIFASRLSTALHRTSSQGTKASWAPKKWYRYPLETFFGKSSKNLIQQNPNSIQEWQLIPNLICHRSGIDDRFGSSWTHGARSFDLFLHYQQNKSRTQCGNFGVGLHFVLSIPSIRSGMLTNILWWYDFQF